MSYLQSAFSLDSIDLCRSTILVKQAPISLVAPESNKVIQLKVGTWMLKETNKRLDFKIRLLYVYGIQYCRYIRSKNNIDTR